MAAMFGHGAVLATAELKPGLKKETVVEGKGDIPAGGVEVLAHYTGKLMDGTVFDSSVKRGKPFSFTLGAGMVIEAWDVGIATMRPGEKAVFTCAPGVAYGARGAPPVIPPNSTLVFEVELLGSKPASAGACSVQ